MELQTLSIYEHTPNRGSVCNWFICLKHQMICLVIHIRLYIANSFMKTVLCKMSAGHQGENNTSQHTIVKMISLHFTDKNLI